MAKKALMIASSYGDAFQDAKELGWQINAKAGIQWQGLMENKDKLVQHVSSMYDDVLSKAEIDRVKGFAKFRDAHTIVVHDAAGDIVSTMTAANILVATGSEPKLAEFPGSELAITSDQALSMERRPQRVAVVGAGPLGVEFASIYAGLGASVDIFFRKALPLTDFDEDCRRAVFVNLKERMRAHAECSPIRIDRLDTGELRLTYAHRLGEKNSVDVDTVLMATGRRPRTAGMDLEKARVSVDEDGYLNVNDKLQTNIPHIWAVGDVLGHKRMLTPVARMEAFALANHLFPPQEGLQRAPQLDYRNIPSAVFCHPPVATVGLSEEAAVEQLTGDVEVYVEQFKTMLHTLAGRHERSFIKMIVHKGTDIVVGVHMVGLDAPSTMQAVAVALKAGVKKEHFDSTLGIHPTAAQELVGMERPARTVKGQGTVTPGMPTGTELQKALA